MRDHLVLIPVYNGAEHLALTLDSVLGQKGVDLRVLVSDNASTDATSEILARYAAADPRLSVVRQPENLGMFGNWNYLLRRVDAPVFTLISHDDLFAHDGVLKAARDIIDAEPGCPVVFSDMAYIGETGLPVAKQRFRRPSPFDPMAWAKRSILTCRNLFGLPLAVRSAAAQGIAFDMTMPYASDLDFAIAVARRGKPAHIARHEVLYRVHLKNGTLRLQVNALADMRRIAEKNGIALSPLARLVQSVLFKVTTRLRAVVLHFARLRTRRSAS